jgi:DNA-binding NtrC family response regulator
LRRLEHDVVECQSGEEALDIFFKDDYPLVLTDLKMPGMSGIDLIKAITSSPSGWKTDCVVFTGYGDMETAVAAMRAHAYDYLLKPVSADELVYLIKRIGEHQQLLRENKRLTEHFNNEVAAATASSRREINRLRKILMQSTTGTTMGFFCDEMKAIAEYACKYHEDRSIPVLIEGETGTGKEVIARLIHYGKLDGASIHPFVDINCAALSSSLFESELFGYESGAFTSSRAKGQRGKLDIAAGGTLFLDEIGEVAMELQAKFLRVIQEKNFYRVGGIKKIPTDVRLICASNANLEQMVEKNQFRRDLFYRLKVGHIRIPPLRERRSDILPLAMLFLRQFAREKKKRFESIAADAVEFIQSYSWPGNVRELRNVIEWVVFMYNDTHIRLHYLPLAVQPKTNVLAAISAAGHDHPKDAEPEVLSIILPNDGYPLNLLKDDIIGYILQKQKGNKSAAARYLRISRKAMGLYLNRMASRKN